MSWGPRYILLGLLLGASLPLGCMNWEYGSPQMVIPPNRGAPSPGVADTLSFIQAAQLCRSAGEELEKKGFTAEAVRQYESARKHDAQAPGVARHLAVLYDLRDNHAAAESEYLRAVQEQPHDAELLNDVGYFHYRHHRLQLAETWLRNALAVNPQCACAWTNLGRVLAEQGRAQESFQAFAHVLRPAEAYSNLGVLLARRGRSNEARTALRQAIALDPALEQPRAFLNALPSAPEVLPPSITHASPKKPLVSVPQSQTSKTPTVSVPQPQTPKSQTPTVSVPQPQTPKTPTVSVPQPQTPKSLTVSVPSPPTLRVLKPSPPPIAIGTTSDRPIIVNVPRATTPTNYAPTLMRSGYDAKKPITPRTPPPPPPVAPRSGVSEQGPILIRTSALLDEPRVEEQSAPELPRPLPAMPLTKPLSPPLPPTPPQATLTDCQADAEGSPAPAP